MATRSYVPLHNRPPNGDSQSTWKAAHFSFRSGEENAGARSSGTAVRHEIRKRSARPPAATDPRNECVYAVRPVYLGRYRGTLITAYRICPFMNFVSSGAGPTHTHHMDLGRMNERLRHLPTSSRSTPDRGNKPSTKCIITNSFRCTLRTSVRFRPPVDAPNT